MSYVTEIVAVLADLNLLTQRDPDALARRQEILATKRELVERLRAEDDPGVNPGGAGPEQTVGSHHARPEHPTRDDDATMPPTRSRRHDTVYECDACGLRALGGQRCEDCGTFMRRVGTGGPCPSCHDPIALSELTDVVQGGRR